MELPFGTPFTAHVTAVSGVPNTVGVNGVRWFTASVAEFGNTVTATLLVIVNVADAVEGAPDARLPVA
jgi:hypothetical protein